MGHDAGADPVDDAVLAAAERDAAEVLDVARLRVEEITRFDGVGPVAEVFDAIWGVPGGGPVIQDEVLRIYAHTGQYVVAGYDAESGELLAASCALVTGPEPGHGFALHSHITGVLPAARGRATGRALKLHQRAWALRRGITVIGWTFDPLVRRNAWFNLARLGALPVAYLPSFYGEMPDAINAGDDTDRLQVLWRLTDPLPPPPPRVGDAPATHRVHGPDADSRRVVALVATPEDIETLRRTDLPAALAWRRLIREALEPALAQGMRITGFTPDGYYIVESG